ncbi:MAG TPA: DUF1295 domain-containing protein [bacterium]|nr:DUF1295 domain-containing protein [bacterium]
MGGMIGITGAALLVYMAGSYLIANRMQNNGIADLAWGGGFILVAVLNLCLSGTFSPRHLWVTGWIVLWGARLIGHVWPRIRSGREDWRYAAMRRRWGVSAAWKSFTHVFLLQGILLFLIAFPLVLIHADASSRWTALDTAGSALLVFGLVFEAVADLQLARFIRTRKSKENPVMKTGLWKYSRHPNYFGEILVWWGLFVIALSAPWGWAAVISPLLITFLLLKVSGVPLLEKRYAGVPEYREYARRTPVFIPWFPKKDR